MRMQWEGRQRRDEAPQLETPCSSAASASFPGESGQPVKGLPLGITPDIDHGGQIGIVRFDLVLLGDGQTAGGNQRQLKGWAHTEV